MRWYNGYRGRERWWVAGSKPTCLSGRSATTVWKEQNEIGQHNRWLEEEVDDGKPKNEVVIMQKLRKGKHRQGYRNQIFVDNHQQPMKSQLYPWNP